MENIIRYLLRSKYEKENRKKGKKFLKREERGKKKEERGKKMKKGEVKG